MTTTETMPAATTDHSSTEVVGAVQWAADDVRIAARLIKQLLGDLRRDLHVALDTTGPRIDQKLPLDVRRSLEQVEQAVAELSVIARDMVLDVKVAMEGDDEDAQAPTIR